MARDPRRGGRVGGLGRPLGGHIGVLALPLLAAAEATAAPGSHASSLPPLRPGAQRVVGEAPLGRGGRLRARRRATRMALDRAVWHAAAAWMEPSDRTPAARARLVRGVRRLVRWYRTRRRRVVGRTYRVWLDVIVDSAALRRRMRAVGIRLVPPGVAVRAGPGCAPFPSPGAALGPTLARAGVRRAEVAPVVLRLRCEVGVPAALGGTGRGPAAAGVAVSLRLRVSLQRAGSARRDLVGVQIAVVGVGSTPEAARQDALRMALAGLSDPLAAALAGRVPDAVGRRVWLRLSGARLGDRLAFARGLRGRISGVWDAAPAILTAAETWVALRVTGPLAALERGVGGAAPPTGWTVTVRRLPKGPRGRPGRALEVQFHPTEETE